jgi:hypothetical protein
MQNNTRQYFVLPLAARRNLDAVAFFREAGRAGAGANMKQQASLSGRAQYAITHKNWQQAADLLQQCTELEQQLIDALE